jgi:ribosomal protein S18 acetylase RimI-like enzyme
MSEAISVEEIRQVTPELVSAVERLVPQLSSTAALPGEAEVAAIVDSDARLFVCRQDTEPGRPIIGMLTLVLFVVPTGLRAMIDVVVDESARGAGTGSALVEAALEAARQAGARNVDLTSRPSREAANRLYVRMGFEPRETNVYRYSFR